MKTVKIDVQDQDNQDRLFEALRLEEISVWKRIKDGIIFICFQVPDSAVTDGGGK